jgi:excisionase family DNA binding protein
MDSRKRSIDEQITALLDIDQAAERLSVHPATLYRWARQKRLPVIRIGARVLRFDPLALEKFIQGNSIGTAKSWLRRGE